MASYNESAYNDLFNSVQSLSSSDIDEWLEKLLNVNRMLGEKHDRVLKVSEKAFLILHVVHAVSRCRIPQSDVVSSD